MTTILLFSLFVIASICVIQGFRKSSFGLAHGPKQHCAGCGWTREKVQLCQLEKGPLAPLCFDCSIKRDAPPFRGISVGVVHAQI